MVDDGRETLIIQHLQKKFVLGICHRLLGVISERLRLIS